MLGFLGIQEIMVLFGVILLILGPKGLLKAIDCMTALGQVEKVMGELSQDLKGEKQ